MSANTNSVSITLSHPTSAFVYAATKPKVLVDGVDVAASGWGQLTIPVAPGKHRIDVWTPYFFPPKAGKATAEVTVTDAPVHLEYMAPSVTFLRGSIGAPGAQKSAGIRPVTVFNVVAVVLALGYLAVKLLT